MKVTMNPLALSFLLSDLSVGPDDVEGLLLGKMTKITSTTIGDNDADQVKDSVHINITGHFTSQVGGYGTKETVEGMCLQRIYIFLLITTFS